MASRDLIFRIFYYPIGVFKRIHKAGVEGSRDLNNTRRFRNAIIDTDVCIDNLSIISRNVHVLSGAVINNSDISEYSYIGKNSAIQNAKIGKFCSVGVHVSIGMGKHPIEHFSTATIFYRKRNTLKIDLVDEDLDFKEYEPVEIGHDVWIGARAMIMDGVNVGTGAVIAANSVVTKDVPPYAIVGGVPAKILRYRFEQNKIDYLLQSEWWNEELHTIKGKMKILNETNDINGL